MSLEQFIATIWRRKLSFLLTLLLCLAAVIGGTLALPPKYSATVTMFVGERSEDSQSLVFDTGAGEQLARTFTTLAAHPNVADVVRRRVGGFRTTEDLLDRMSFAPVERTQLLEITATATSPWAARRLANVYGGTLVAQVAGQFARGVVPTRIALSQPAALPSSPSSPNIPLFLGIGALLALMLSAGAALLRDRLDGRLRVSLDAETVFNRPVLLRLPNLKGLDLNEKAITSDSVRLLHTNIDILSQGTCRVVAVTSAGPVQGKSTTASYLARTAADDGVRTVLIEADLRRPGLKATGLGIGTRSAPVGLSNYLANVAQLDEIIDQHPEHPDLSVIWSGPLPPNPSVLLGSDRLPELLDALRSRYDRIIIDTPPLSIGSDATLTVARADGTLLVVDVQSTRAPQVSHALTQLDRAGASVLGIILNRALSRRDLSRYGYYADAADGRREPQAAGVSR